MIELSTLRAYFTAMSKLLFFTLLFSCSFSFANDWTCESTSTEITCRGSGETGLEPFPGSEGANKQRQFISFADSWGSLLFLRDVSVERFEGVQKFCWCLVNPSKKEILFHCTSQEPQSFDAPAVINAEIEKLRNF